MKKNKFTENQIVFVLRQADTCVTVAEICRKMSISEVTYYNCTKKYGCLGVPELRRIKQLEKKSQHRRHLVADLSLGKQIMQEGLKKSFEARVALPRGSTSHRHLPHLGSSSLPSAPFITRRLRLSELHRRDDTILRQHLHELAQVRVHYDSQCTLPRLVSQ